MKLRVFAVCLSLVLVAAPNEWAEAQQREERRTFAGFRFHPNAPAMHLDYAFRDRQAEADLLTYLDRQCDVKSPPN